MARRQQRSRVGRVGRVGRVFRVFALLLVLAASALASCDSSKSADSGDDSVASGDGIEVTLAVRGNGRVTSEPAALDCPSNCFLRVAGADPAVDGSPVGLTLSATPGSGSHFTGWSAQPFVSGLRANGPADCSPMTRNAIGPPIGPVDDTIVLPYGATQGTPPPGHEIECAPYTAVPVAYSLVATFEEDAPGPFEQEDAAPPGDVLFEPPVLGTVVAREIGVHGDMLYFRYDQNSAVSGIAAGAKDGQSGTRLVYTSDSLFSIVSIGRHLALEDGNLTTTSMNLDTLAIAPQFFGVSCTGLTTDATTVYCRWTSGESTYVYSWLVGMTNNAQYLFTLPPGNAIVVDDTNMYFSETPEGTPIAIPAQSPGRIARTPKQPDGGAGAIVDASPFVSDLTNPIELQLSPTKLFWLDKEGNAETPGFTPTSGAEAGVVTTMSAAQGDSPSFFALDPSDPETFYLGGSTDNSIVRGRTSAPFAVELFRTNVVGLGGIAVDDTYVYWTQSDGRVYRTRKDQTQ